MVALEPLCSKLSILIAVSVREHRVELPEYNSHPSVMRTRPHAEFSGEGVLCSLRQKLAWILARRNAQKRTPQCKLAKYPPLCQFSRG